MRITKKHVEAKIETLNGMLGNDGQYRTVGAVNLYSAYDAYGVHRTANDSAGQSDLMGGLGTLRECARFVDGMIAAMRIMEDEPECRRRRIAASPMQ